MLFNQDKKDALKTYFKNSADYKTSSRPQVTLIRQHFNVLENFDTFINHSVRSFF